MSLALPLALAGKNLPRAVHVQNASAAERQRAALSHLEAAHHDTAAAATVAELAVVKARTDALVLRLGLEVGGAVPGHDQHHVHGSRGSGGDDPDEPGLKYINSTGGRRPALLRPAAKQFSPRGLGFAVVDLVTDKVWGIAVGESDDRSCYILCSSRVAKKSTMGRKWRWRSPESQELRPWARPIETAAWEQSLGVSASGEFVRYEASKALACSSAAETGIVALRAAEADRVACRLAQWAEMKSGARASAEEFELRARHSQKSWARRLRGTAFLRVVSRANLPYVATCAS